MQSPYVYAHLWKFLKDLYADLCSVIDMQVNDGLEGKPNLTLAWRRKENKTGIVGLSCLSDLCSGQLKNNCKEGMEKILKGIYWC